MTPTEIIAQVIGIFAMACNILSYQQKTQKGVLCFQLMGGALFSVNFFMLGAIIGGLLNVIAFIRAILFIFKDRLHTDNTYWFVGFIIVFIVCYALTFTVFQKEPTFINFIIELLPVIGMVALTIGFRMKDAKHIRLCGLVSSPSWLIYNIIAFSIGAIVCEAISIVSIFVGMIRLDKKKA
ncbi:MAG: YgjV family protein [Clostridia bacterium]|nr:YgjV family protein [Clostridia bacterium]